VAGDFDTAGGHAARNLAVWDGTSWSAVAGAAFESSVLALASHGRRRAGPALYAGGPFVNVAGVAMNHVARWDGAHWSPLGEGGARHRPQARRHGHGLQVGGDLSTTPAGDSYLANWGARHRARK
jgi:hypothetical protein